MQSQIFTKNKKNLLIRSGDGEFRPFSGIVRTKMQDLVRVRFSNGAVIRCTPDHIFKMWNKKKGVYFAPSRSVKPNDLTVTKLSIISVEACTEKEDVFDVTDVENNNAYMVNGVVNQNCIYLDELAFISPRIQRELWASLVPTLSTGGSAIISSTPNGDTELYAQLWREATSNGIGATGSNGFHSSRVYWDEHPDRGEEYWNQMVSQLGTLVARQEVLCIGAKSVVNSSVGLLTIEELYDSISSNEICTIDD